MLDKLIKSLLTQDRLNRLGLRQETQEDLDKLVPIIEFYCEPQLRGVVKEPEMAAKNIAEWWKAVPARMPVSQNAPRDQFGAVAMTVKKCIPMLDGMMLGYTMVSAVDINVRMNDDGKLMDVRSGPFWNGVSKHDATQLGKIEGQKSTSPVGLSPAIKFHNPWVIRTRPGYSTLFIPPINHVEEKRFVCLGAVVDTDTYPKQVNFPALWFDKGCDTLIPAGTPLVTAIPFKRADVPRELLIRSMTAAERHQIDVMSNIQNARSHMYTHELREDRK